MATEQTNTDPAADIFEASVDFAQFVRAACRTFDRLLDEIGHADSKAFDAKQEMQVIVAGINQRVTDFYDEIDAATPEQAA